MFFSHGSEHSRGVLILIKNTLEFDLGSIFRFNVVKSPLCTFCTVDEESLEHLLFFANRTILVKDSILAGSLQR